MRAVFWFRFFFFAALACLTKSVAHHVSSIRCSREVSCLFPHRSTTQGAVYAVWARPRPFRGP